MNRPIFIVVVIIISLIRRVGIRIRVKNMIQADTPSFKKQIPTI